MTALLALAAHAADADPAAPPSGPDRSAPPLVAPPDLLVHPEPEVHPLGPGVEAWFVRVPGVRKTVVHVALRRGTVELLGGPTQAGRAFGWLADVAAGDLDAAALSEQTDLLDVDLVSSIGLHGGSVELVVPTESLPDGLALQRLVVREPSFPKKDVKRWVADQELFYTVQGPSSQGSVASSALAFSWFPPDHPYGRRPDLAELRDVKTRTLDGLWQRWIREAPVTVLVVGDVAWADVEPGLRTVLDGLGRAVEPGNGLPVEPPATARLVAVDMPGQDQVAVRLRMAAPPRDHADQPEMMATNWLFGGHFLSRLNRNLREEKGYTYGSRSIYRSGETWGNVTVEVDVKAENLAETLGEIQAELDALAGSPPDAAELDAMRRSTFSDWNRTRENAERAAALYESALDERHTVAELRARTEAMAATTTEDVARVAREWLSADRPRVWVVVGDRHAIEAELAGQPLAAEWIDPTTAILGTFQPSRGTP